ncbi:flotillin-like FloA family protein, partial [Candidatus Bipolaricaulota bacterium]|nr:flotillin-like FloA family protein [Candidatus Bipolaricaulota bacterium]
MTAYIVVAVLAILVLWIFFYFVPVGLWISALAAGVPIGPMTLVGMRLRKVNPHKVIGPMITAWKAGLQPSVTELEAHVLAGGDVQRVVRALISADKAEIELNFQRAAAIDLAGRDVYGAVAMSVNPRVIETPKIGAVAKDGIQLFALARVTVRANIERLVGGATEETIIA